jgi:hypothetical protein
MTEHPFDSGELGRTDPELDRLGQQLERYAADVADVPPLDLAVRIRAAIGDEPTPSAGWWTSLLGVLATWHGPARLALAAAVVLAAVVGAVTLGELANRARTNTGATPSPSVIVTPTPAPTPTPTVQPTPTPTPSTSASPTPTPLPTESEDDDDEPETPEPTETEDEDNSGPGGGGGGNSGPGGGG